MVLPPSHRRGNPGASRTRVRAPSSPPELPPPPLDAHERVIVDRVLGAVVPHLRAAIAEALDASRPRPPSRPRHGARPGDLDGEVDEVARARARRLLARHGGRR